jgi:hypothetical protein
MCYDTSPLFLFPNVAGVVRLIFRIAQQKCSSVFEGNAVNRRGGQVWLPYLKSFLPPAKRVTLPTFAAQRGGF